MVSTISLVLSSTLLCHKYYIFPSYQFLDNPMGYLVSVGFELYFLTVNLWLLEQEYTSTFLNRELRHPCGGCAYHSISTCWQNYRDTRYSGPYVVHRPSLSYVENSFLTIFHVQCETANVKEALYYNNEFCTSNSSF